MTKSQQGIKIYNLRERIFAFVLKVISLARKLPTDAVNKILVGQIIRSATAIGAIYEEADGTPTRKDFIYKMGLIKKEAKETKYWLRLTRATYESKLFEEIDLLLQEDEELIRIFSSIIIKSNV